MSSRIWIASVVLVVAGWSAPPAAAAPVLTLLPSGDISGAPGATVGWGYEIANDDPGQWLVLTGVGADPFLLGAPDGSVFDFPIVAPGATVTRPLDLVGQVGLFAFTWDAGAPAASVNTGTFVVAAEWWDGDPLVDGAQLGPADDLTAPYSVTALAAVPEPASATLWLLAAGGALARRFRP